MGSIGLSDYEGVTSPAYDVLRKTSKSVDARYFSYLFRTEIAKQIFKKNSRGIMDMRLRLYFDKLGAITVPLPSFTTQQAISNYLDTKTTQIDKKIDLLNQKTTHYEKLKQSLINETITRGLDKEAPLKDSEIEWVGCIPRHWNIARIKEVSNINKKALPESTPQDYEFHYLDIGGVTYGSTSYKTEKLVFKTSPSRARRVTQNGDIIISTVRTYLKAIAKIQNHEDLIVSTGFSVLSPTKKINSDFFASWLMVTVQPPPKKIG